ncbi:MULTISPECIES: BMP family ABC transporter substrate-binding protein [Exiguobacterium]|jgi:basic membrane protein A|uniref:ABC transporter substrate-binding protein n=1 Tax=Exiguobacterium chiriqhucha RW-2 TaxID=1345023 RepID=U1N3A5_9BACL|nr:MULTISPECIES: BMP family ABC transporter substrate-binding protein [Exiguobacterium]ERG68391.1 ABC transporter substrate-binding protein [Exiguobacterium chiriqhucha RW-2]TCI72682.1 BMP family ABC transporter substrate-binding protein [Exiguobacterium sp. IPCI3]TCI82082.1 BMP family ABC transporter substrate-binding protein [Exiguobacterium sp. IPCH1]TCI83587.1 BMP family ABC transporter substrate-binding protein [Exiguobacterium sp. IPBC4]
MKKSLIIGLLAACVTWLPGCQSVIDQPEATVETRQSMGVVLSDVGLGDQSFSDAAMRGMGQLRETGEWFVDYRELDETETYKAGFEQLVADGHDVIIGLGFACQEDLEAVAAEHPEQQFALIDAVSTLPNVMSVTFKETEGSALAGAVAGLETESNKIGFIGGVDNELIQKFGTGFELGAKSVNDDVTMLVDYANDFASPEIGRELAEKQIEAGADVLYAAAGLTGVGVLEAAERNGVKAIGVDSDQSMIAPDAVITSMLKQVDLAIVEIANRLENEAFNTHVELGIDQNGVGLAALRRVQWDDEETKQFEAFQKQLMEGTLK